LAFIRPCFLINLHKKDKALLEAIKVFFGVGKFDKDDSKSIGFVVSSIKELEVIIKHFDKYPLLTQKQADYLLFKLVFALFFCFFRSFRSFLNPNYIILGLRN